MGKPQVVMVVGHVGVGTTLASTIAKMEDTHDITVISPEQAKDMGIIPEPKTYKLTAPEPLATYDYFVEGSPTARNKRRAEKRKPKRKGKWRK